jgi:hypothetical protein
MRSHEVGGLSSLDRGLGRSHDKMRLPDSRLTLRNHVDGLMYEPQVSCSLICRSSIDG